MVSPAQGKKAEGREWCQLAHSLMDPGPSGDAAAGTGQTGSLLQDGPWIT